MLNSDLKVECALPLRQAQCQGKLCNRNQIAARRQGIAYVGNTITQSTNNNLNNQKNCTT